MEGYNHRQEIFSLTIDEEAKGHLLETARWTKFIAIMGFVFLGLLLLAALAMVAGFSQMSELSGLGSSFGIGMALMYCLIGLLYFFPVFYLYKFSVLIRPAINSGNQTLFNQALSYKRKMFKFIGILFLVILGLYAIVFVFGILGVLIGSA